MKIDLYTLCYNEMDILPFVVDYWKRFASKVIVYDNGSTDGSVEFLKQFDWITVKNFKTDGMNDAIQRDIKNECWKDSIGKADYVVVCDMDEIVYSENLDEELQEMSENGYTVMGCKWYAFCNDNKPEYCEGKLLHQLCDKFYKQKINWNYNDLGKFLLFNPNKISNMNYGIGCHTCKPNGDFKLFMSKKTLFLHIDKGFGVNYMINKKKIMNERLSETNRKNNWCFHYGYSAEKITEEYIENQKKSININDFNLNEYSTNNDNLDIFICTHKDFEPLVTNEVYKPINCNDINNDTWNGLKGSFYSEIMTYFHIAENYPLKDYIGFCHYRKYWSFKDNIPDVEKIIGNDGVIAAMPIRFNMSVKEQYSYFHNIEDLNILTSIIEEKYPEYIKSWNNFLDGNFMFPYNMFIMKRENFLEYVDFIKSILDKYVEIVGTDIVKRIENNKDKYLKDFSPNNTVDYQYRIGGYLCERLTNLFILTHYKKITCYDIIITEEKYK